MNKINELNFISKKINKCEKCALHLTRNKTVPGEGNPDSDIVFLGEGPGADEDATGRPFVGRAGKLLDVMINEWAKIKREDIYITNIVKCRPPKNRVPSNEEMDSCISYLEAQLLLIKPKLIVCLGSTSYKYLISNSLSISEARGKFFDWMDSIKVFPTFHPSYLLRNHSIEKGSPRSFAALDMKVISFIFKELKSKSNINGIIEEVEKRMKTTGR